MKTFLKDIIKIIIASVFITFAILGIKSCLNIDKFFPSIPTMQFRSIDNSHFTTSKNLDIKLKKFNRNWHPDNRQKAIEALIIGEQKYNIDHRLVLAIISVESEFKITQFHKNSDCTIDYGLTQTNSKSIKKRYTKSQKILNEYKIQCTDSKYDISKNIMSCYVFLNDIRNESEFDAKGIIMAYNLGIKGATLKNKQAKGECYFNAVMREYQEF